MQREDVDWTQLILASVQWWALLNAVINFQVAYNTGNVLTN